MGWKQRTVINSYTATDSYRTVQLLNADGTLAFEVTLEEIKFPFFSFDESTVEGKVFPMLPKIRISGNQSSRRATNCVPTFTCSMHWRLYLSPVQADLNSCQCRVPGEEAGEGTKVSWSIWFIGDKSGVECTRILHVWWCCTTSKPLYPIRPTS